MWCCSGDGELWGPGQDNGYHTATETLTTSAEDEGGGVKSITLAADGQPVATYTATCNYTYPQPCPTTTGPQTLTLPTITLPDGTHSLTLTATDAAGNTSTTATQQITIDNNPPPPPTQLTATPTGPGSNTYTINWQNPPSQPAPITNATYQLCPSNPSPCAPPTPAPPTGPITITTPGPGTWNLNLWLTNAAGHTNPANYATTIITTPEPLLLISSQQSELSTSSELSNNSGSPAQSTKVATDHTVLSLTKARRGRNLIVHLSGPRNATAYISYLVILHNKVIAHGKRTVALNNGRTTIMIKLPLHTVAKALVHMVAHLVAH